MAKSVSACGKNSRATADENLFLTLLPLTHYAIYATYKVWKDKVLLTSTNIKDTQLQDELTNMYCYDRKRLMPTVKVEIARQFLSLRVRRKYYERSIFTFLEKYELCSSVFHVLAGLITNFSNNFCFKFEKSIYLH